MKGKGEDGYKMREGEYSTVDEYSNARMLEKERRGGSD